MEYGIQKVCIRLCEEGREYTRYKLDSPQKAVKHLRKYLAECDRETVIVVSLKHNHTVANFHVVSQGSLSVSVAEPREIFKAAILSNANAIILMHCHPSGSVEPSAEDDKCTATIRDAGKLLNIPLLDHIIVGGGNSEAYFSYEENRRL